MAELAEEEVEGDWVSEELDFVCIVLPIGIAYWPLLFPCRRTAAVIPLWAAPIGPGVEGSLLAPVWAATYVPGWPPRPGNALGGMRAGSCTLLQCFSDS